MKVHGYLQSDYPLPLAVAEQIRETWEASLAAGKTPILGNGIRFVPFPVQSIEVQCEYCFQHRKLFDECRHCGAPPLGEFHGDTQLA